MRLTVVIPTLCRPAQLTRALERLGDADVVVAADAAEPDIERVRRIAAGRTVVQAKVPGVSAARNAGWRVARGDVVLFLGDDILAEPGLLAAHARVHENEPAVEVAAQGHVRWADELPHTTFMDYIDQGRWQFDFPADSETDAGWGR